MQVISFRGYLAKQCFSVIATLQISLFGRKLSSKKNSLAGKNNHINKTKEPHYFRTSSFRISKTKEPHYFLTSSFRISKNIFEGVFRGDFFCQRIVLQGIFLLVYFQGVHSKSFFPKTLLPNILCSKLFLKRSYFFPRSFFIEFFSKIFFQSR